jgi:RHS repeat-associated protein
MIRSATRSRAPGRRSPTRRSTCQRRPGQGAAPVTLDYDGDQQRVRKTAGDEVTVYVDGLYERTTNTKTSAVEHRYFVHGSERVVAMVTRSSAPTSEEKTRYLHVDNLGSVETVTDETGSTSAEKRSYDAFGARRNPSWGAAPVAFSSLTTRGFTGHEDDEELGLVNMKGRLYDPKVGRFLTTDPIVSHPGFGQSWNPYSYVLNNPLAYTDPSGFGDDPLAPFSPGCTHCVGGTSRDGATTVTWVYDGPITPPPPNVGASLAGLTTVPVDLNATGNKAASTPQPPPDGGNGCGGAGQNLALSAGGGGADSGALTQAALHPADYRGFRQNANEQSREYAIMAALAPMRAPVVVGVIAFGLTNPDPAYGPTPQTVPTDRPTNLERLVEIGVPIALGAVITGIGRSPNVVTGEAAPAAGAASPVTGEFSIIDWAGYPDGVPKPTGPFRLLAGAEYTEAREVASRANRAMHRVDPSLVGKEVHEIHPVKFGGSPTDQANKIPLPPSIHHPMTAWWNKLRNDLQKP